MQRHCYLCASGRCGGENKRREVGFPKPFISGMKRVTGSIIFMCIFSLLMYKKVLLQHATATCLSPVTAPTLNPSITSNHVPEINRQLKLQARITSCDDPAPNDGGWCEEPQHWVPDQSKSCHPRDCGTRGKQGCSCSQSTSLRSAGATSQRMLQHYSVVP